MAVRSLALVLGFAAVFGQTAAKQSPREAAVRDLKLDTSPATRAIQQLPASNKRWALIVGVDRYDDPQVSGLQGAANDAKALANSFVKYAGFPEDQVIVLSSTEPAERQPTKGNILIRLANVSRLLPKDGLFLFAFAGHGIERNGQAYLLPSDSKVTDNIRVLEATALPVNEIKDWIKEMGVKQVLVLLDACRNDPTAGRSDTPNRLTEAYRKGFNFDFRNQEVEAFATLYATKVGERAYEFAEKRHGYFTWAITEALAGKAANERGEVTLGGLQKYIQDAVPRRVKIDLGEGRDQRPFADIRGYRADELVLAKVDLAAAAREAAAPDPRVLEMEEWQRVSTSRDIAQIKAFASKYPAGVFAEQANRALEHAAWEAVKGSANPADLRHFVDDFPSGPYAQQARLRIQELDRIDADRRAVEEALGLLTAGYAARDIERVKAAWPSLGRRELSRVEDFFKMARSIQMNLAPIEPANVSADAAEIRCMRTIQFNDERGAQRPVEDRVLVKLQRNGPRWIILSIQ